MNRRRSATMAGMEKQQPKPSPACPSCGGTESLDGYMMAPDEFGKLPSAVGSGRARKCRTCGYLFAYASHSLEIDPHRLTLTVREPSLFKVAEIVVFDLGIGELSNDGDCLLIRCANADDLALLGRVLADRAS